MVQRHDPDRPVRRRPDGRRRFRVARRRNQFRHAPERVEARCAARSGVGDEQLRRAQERSAAAAGRANAARQVIRVSTTNPASATARSCGCGRSCGSPAISRCRSPNSPPTSRHSIRKRCWPNRRRRRGSADERRPPSPTPKSSFVTRDLARVLPRVKIARRGAARRSVARVREAANWSDGSRRVAGSIAADAIAGIKLAYAAEGARRSLCRLRGPHRARKTSRCCRRRRRRPPAATPGTRRTSSPRKATSVASILRDLGATPTRSRRSPRRSGRAAATAALKEGQKLRVLLAPGAGTAAAAAGARDRRRRHAIEAVVALSDTGKYVAVDVRSIDTEIADSRRGRRGRRQAACGSIRASTRPRCATRCRVR